MLKNVTGLDMCKLLTGSHGTLGVLTEITLKVLPAPERTGTVALRGLDAGQAVAALSAALGSPWSVSGAAYLPAEAASLLPGGSAQSMTLARIEDFAESVAYRTEQLRQALAEFGTADILDHEASLASWSAIRHASVLPAEPGDAIWRISVRPSRGAAVLQAAAAQGARGYLDLGRRPRHAGRPCKRSFAWGVDAHGSRRRWGYGPCFAPPSRCAPPSPSSRQSPRR